MKKTAFVKIRFTPKEKLALEKVAKGLFTSLSPWARAVLLGAAKEAKNAPSRQ